MLKESLTTLRLLIGFFALSAAWDSFHIASVFIQNPRIDIALVPTLIVVVISALGYGYIAAQLPALLPQRKDFVIQLIVGLFLLGTADLLIGSIFLAQMAMNGTYEIVFFAQPLLDILAIVLGMLLLSGTITWILVSSVNRLSRPEPIGYDWRFQVLAWIVLFLFAGTMLGLILSTSELVL